MMISLNHFMAFIVVNIVRGFLRIPTFQEEIASHCFGPGNGSVCARASIHCTWVPLWMLVIHIQPWHYQFLLILTMLTRTRKILYRLSIQDLPEYCFHLLLRGKAGIPIGFLIWKMTNFLRWCVLHLLVWKPLRGLLLAPLFWSFKAKILQGPSSCTSPEMLSSFLPMISPSRETKILGPIFCIV